MMTSFPPFTSILICVHSQLIHSQLKILAHQTLSLPSQYTNLPYQFSFICCPFCSVVDLYFYRSRIYALIVCSATKTDHVFLLVRTQVSYFKFRLELIMIIDKLIHSSPVSCLHLVSTNSLDFLTKTHLKKNVQGGAFCFGHDIYLKCVRRKSGCHRFLGSLPTTRCTWKNCQQFQSTSHINSFIHIRYFRQ